LILVYHLTYMCWSLCSAHSRCSVQWLNKEVCHWRCYWYRSRMEWRQIGWTGWRGMCFQRRQRNEKLIFSKYLSLLYRKAGIYSCPTVIKESQVDQSFASAAWKFVFCCPWSKL